MMCSEFIKDLQLSRSALSVLELFRIGKISILIMKRHHKLSQSSASLHLTPAWNCALGIAASRVGGGQRDPNILA